MIVFGESHRRDGAVDKLAVIATLLSEAPARGIERHERLVAALIEAGELAQGLADDAFAVDGRDAESPPVSASMALCVALATQVRRSWLGGLDAAKGQASTALTALAALGLPSSLDIRRPEGFAHYAVYPEAYLEAAGLVATDGPVTVIGIRSIGTTLAALVAASLPVVSEPRTVRPVGHPFRRELSLEPAFAAALAGPEGGVHVIADEGPGLSGSSVAAVASCLERQGVAPGRIHILPSHAGEPGPEATPAIRRVWRTARRHVRSFDEVVLGSPAPARRLEAWVADLTGPPTGPLVDISGGGWRDRRAFAAERWPPVHGWGERRKFLLPTAAGIWLLKFAGLDRIGRGLSRYAEALAEAGFTPEHAGMRHGFTIDRWCGDARTIDASGSDRDRLVARLGAYLGFRSRAFPVESGRGASPERLLAMARANALEALGEAAAERLDAWRPALDRLAGRVRPIATDNRLHPWEWIVAGGRLLKTDAMDHHAGHDLIGCQDVAWDVAGAAIELSLSDGETWKLAHLVEQEGGHSVDSELLAFASVCYPAFQLGFWTFAGGSAADPAESRRARGAAQRYGDQLRRLLWSDCASQTVRCRTIEAVEPSAK